jgi:hypothetical protein
LEVSSKVESRSVAVKITDKTQLVFGNVGPEEAKLTEGYHAEVWLEKDGKDVAARVRLRGNRKAAPAVWNDKLAPPDRVGTLAAVAPGGKGITLELPKKGEPGEKVEIRLAEKSRVLFFNVARGAARMTAGYETRVWLEDNSPDTARAVSFFGTAEEKPAEGKGPPADRSGRLVGVSGDGKVLTVDVPAAEKGEWTKTEIKLTNTTSESYHGVAAEGAKPTKGYHIQVWLAEGSSDTAARVRLTRSDPRTSVDARVVAVSADGARLTVETPTAGGKSEPIRREIKLSAKTRLVFFNIGPGGARLTEGYHVRGWLAEGSEDTAEELMVSGAEKPEGKKPADKNPTGQKRGETR